MATRPLDNERAVAAAKAVAEHGSVSAAARAAGMPVETFRHHVRIGRALLGGADGSKGGVSAPAEPPRPPTADERREILRLRARVAQLERERDEQDGHAVLAQAIADARAGIAASSIEPPAWTVRGERTKDSPGVPTLLLTDWHVGETVRAAETFGANAFDAAVADARVRLAVERAILLGGMHAPAGGHKGGVVMLGGDFVSGWLHDELVRTDWCSPLQSAAWCVSRLLWTIRRLRDEWGRLYVVGVPGNHGRLSKRPPAKAHAFQAYDWLIYTMLAQQLGDNTADRKTITVSVPEDSEQILPIAGHRYLLMHGHQLGVSGGDGIIGSLGPIMRGATKVGRQSRSVGREFDTLVIGHYHQTHWLPGVIVGPTLKGFDEYAKLSLRATYEPAAQLLWFTHPKWGPNSPLRIFLQDPPVRDQACVTRRAA